MCYTLGMTYSDGFGSWDTATLASIAWRVTPQHERSDWVCTADNREWHIRDGVARATNGSRDENGRSIVVMELAAEDLREFVVEQLEALGIDYAAVNHMKS